MNNERWERDEILPPQLAQDLSSLRESIHTNELLRAKLRKQLLSDISSASSDRPRHLKEDDQRKQVLRWTPVAGAAVVLIGLLSYNLFGQPDAVKVKNVEVVQQRQLFTVTYDSMRPPSTTVTNDMRFLAYERNNTIWIHGMDSGYSQELLSPPTGGSYRDPSFSPDGSTIAVSLQEKDRTKIGVISFRTREVRQITSPPPGYADIQPVYSKDGVYLAFIRTKVQGNTSQADDGELWIMKTDGSQAEKVIDHAFEPAWSPDGKKFVFSRLKNSNREIWQVDKKGSGEKKLAEGQKPVWSASGHFIAYVNPRSEIWIMDQFGEQNTRLTMISVNTEVDSQPIWAVNDHSLYFVRRGEVTNTIHFQQLDLMYH